MYWGIIRNFIYAFWNTFLHAFWNVRAFWNTFLHAFWNVRAFWNTFLRRLETEMSSLSPTHSACCCYFQSHHPKWNLGCWPGIEQYHRLSGTYSLNWLYNSQIFFCHTLSNPRYILSLFYLAFFFFIYYRLSHERYSKQIITAFMLLLFVEKWLMYWGTIRALSRDICTIFQSSVPHPISFHFCITSQKIDFNFTNTFFIHRFLSTDTANKHVLHHLLWCIHRAHSQTNLLSHWRMR